MKRLLCVLAVLTVGATSFAEKPRFGLDFAWGPVFGFQNIGYSFDNAIASAVLPEGTLKRTDILLPLVKISSYNFFLLDNMLGLHASLSYSPIGLSTGTKLVGDKTIEAHEDSFMGMQDLLWGIEFMIGPAFGIDLNETVRFQTGLDFHLLFAMEYFGTTYKEDVVENYTYISRSSTHRESLVSYGIGLTPQLRFSPGKRISFILGCDFAFDFGVNTNKKYFEYDVDSRTATVEIPAYTVDNYFRFGINPYLGFGINL